MTARIGFDLDTLSVCSYMEIYLEISRPHAYIYRMMRGRRSPPPYPLEGWARKATLACYLPRLLLCAYLHYLLGYVEWVGVGWEGGAFGPVRGGLSDVCY